MATLPQKPAPLPVNAAGIPDLLKGKDRWVNWSWSWRGKKWDKPPRQGDGSMASSTDAATWTTFDLALAAHQRGDFDGIGFVLGKDGDTGATFSGLDLDHCIDDGQVQAPAIYLASRLDSYTERSPSGAGLKVFTIGALPAGRKKDDDRGVEFYDSGRYFTVTGDTLSWSPPNVNERTTELASLHAAIFPVLPNGLGRRLEEKEIAVAALKALDTRRAVGYYEWLHVGMALHSVSSDLCGEWDNWSRAAPEKYQDGACEKKWATFKKSGIGVGSLIQWAREDGWDWPKSYQSNGHAKAKEKEEQKEKKKHPDDDHMGDGLTECEGAGPWELVIKMGDPRTYLLKSPIWESSTNLKDGFVTLTKQQIVSWAKIRIEAIDQSGAHVLADSSKKPVWDGRKGPQLFKRLLASARRIQPTTNYDRVLAAAEFILDIGRRAAPLSEETTSARDILRTEDGTILFRVHGIANRAKKEVSGIDWADLREAATRYGGEFCPRIAGKRPRYSSFDNQQIENIESEIARRVEVNGHTIDD